MNWLLFYVSNNRDDKYVTTRKNKLKLYTYNQFYNKIMLLIDAKRLLNMNENSSVLSYDWNKTQLQFRIYEWFTIYSENRFNYVKLNSEFIQELLSK